MSTAQIDVASSNAYIFSNASNNDVVMYTSDESMGILIGTKSNANAGIMVDSSNISFAVQPGNSNGAISFYGGNSNQLVTVLGSGNVGIGKSNPAYPLDVAGDINFTGAFRQGGVPYVGSQWSNVGCNVFLLNSNVGIGKSNPAYPLDVAGDINFTGTFRQNGSPYVGSQWSNTSNKLFILGSNVGIGTSNPSCALQVSGDLQVDSNLILGNRAIQMQGIKILQNTGTGVMNITSSVTSIPGYAYNSNLTFSPYSGCNVLVANGKLGVGTSNPTDTLTISGNNSGFTYDLTGNSILSNAPTTYGLKFLNSTLNYTNETTVDPTPNTLYGGILLRSYTTYAGTGIYNFENRANVGMGLVVRNGNSSNVEALSIDYTGKVGIGKSNPAYTLDVVGGTVAATTFYGSNANFSNVTVPGAVTEGGSLLSVKYAPSNTLSNYVLTSTANTTYTNATNISSGTLAAARLPTSGVTAGTYGSTSNVPVITLDTYGRVTSASTAAISSGGAGTTFSNATVGTAAAPLNGGTINLDVSTNNNAIIELSSGTGALTLNLYNGGGSTWNDAVIGKTGKITLIERSTSGRTITFDSRLMNSNQTPSTTTTLCPIGTGAYAVDSLDYFILNASMASLVYNRIFTKIGSFTNQYTSVGTTTWTSPLTGTIKVLVVAGGGGTGGSIAGGGGGGGVVYNTAYSVTAGTQYTITVGGGGSSYCTSGSNSVFDNITAIGGGYGGIYGTSAPASGGCGGGGAGNSTSAPLVSGAAGSSGGAGGNGRVASSGSYAGGGGGGGAGGAGSNASATSGGVGGAGGIGYACDITGVTVYYGGGGGGASRYSAGGAGGNGGGGNGAGGSGATTTSFAVAGSNGLGGGAGGGANEGSGAAGGSGVVIISR